MLIIDGYNLIFSSPAIHKKRHASADFLEKAREHLIAQLEYYNTKKHHRIIVVFDGKEGGHYNSRQKTASGIEIIFSAQDSSADEVIINLVAEYRSSTACGAPSYWRATSGATPGDPIGVVTSDRELAQTIMKDAQVIPVNKFIRELSDKNGSETDSGEPIEKLIGLSPADVPKWLKVFGEET